MSTADFPAVVEEAHNRPCRTAGIDRLNDVEQIKHVSTSPENEQGLQRRGAAHHYLRSSLLKLAEGAADRIYLRRADLREHRQRQHLVGSLLGVRESPGAVPEV